MRFGTAGVTRYAMLLALVCAGFGALAPSAMAGGGGKQHSYGGKQYSYVVNVSPATAPAGDSTTFDVALRNSSSPGISLGSAALTPPLGFRVTGASLPAGAKGHVFVLFNIVVLDGVNVPSGSTLHVAVRANAPSRCKNYFVDWLSLANASRLFGPRLRLDIANSSLTTHVTCAPPASALQFDTQPNDALVSDVITGSANDTTGPPVTVDIVDSGGNVVDSSAPVTVALGNNPGGATLGGTLTENAVHGVATFNDLTLDKPDNGYTLAASSSGLTNATSNSFDENNTATPCPTGATCTNTITSGSGSLQVDVGSGSTDATLTESVDVGKPMDGPDTSKADPGCADYTPPDASADWYEFVVQPADGQTFDRSKTVTWTVKGASSDGFQVCFGAPYEFPVVDPTTGEAEQAPAGTLPDGSQGFVGLLARCVVGNVAIAVPCVESVSTQEDPNSQTGVDAVAVVTIPAGEPGDPWMGR
jgi:hypothetical protein